MFCKNCGEQMNDNQAICIKCGVKTGVGNKFCANCGNATDPNASVCTNCGVALKSAASTSYGNYDKITMALICIFLGELGVHNFMMGETKKGVLRLLLTLFVFGTGWILALIDFINILTDKYVIDPEKFI